MLDPRSLIRGIKASEIPRENLHCGQGEPLVLLVEHLFAVENLASNVDWTPALISFKALVALDFLPLVLATIFLALGDKGVWMIATLLRFLTKESNRSTIVKGAL